MFFPEAGAEKKGYRPHNPVYRIKGDPLVRYTYFEGQKEREFLIRAQSFPELIIVVESVNAMGLLPCCPEMLIWADFVEKILYGEQQGYDGTCLKKICESIAKAEDAAKILRKLYFSLVLPVAQQWTRDTQILHTKFM